MGFSAHVVGNRVHDIDPVTCAGIRHAIGGVGNQHVVKRNSAAFDENSLGMFALFVRRSAQPLIRE